MSALLTLKEVAKLQNKEYDTVLKQAQRGKLKAIKITTDSRQGWEYRISFNELTERERARYYAMQQQIEQPVLDEPETPEKYEQDIEELTGEQRDDIAFWKRAIDSWRNYIEDFPKQKTAKTREFIKIFNDMNPDRAISERTLRNKYKLYKEFGEVALADHRKNRKDRGTTTIHPTLTDVFEQWWLDESRPSVAFVYNLICAWVKMDMPQLAPVSSYDSFYRYAKSIERDVIEYYRYGKKHYSDKVASYVQRDYGRINSNDVWSADYHTLDIFVKDDLTGKVFRPHVVVWIDVRSRKILSMTLCESSNSDGVITSFKRAVKPWGLPSSTHLDNGREFLTRAFGGKGRRKSDVKADYGTPMLERLEITMINALPANGKGKVIERAFKNVAAEFSTGYLTYTGGRPDRRPERLTNVLKDENNIPMRSEVEKDLWAYLEGWHNNRASQADGLNGQTPNACYEANLITKRTATQDQLDILTLKTTKAQKVDRNGVRLKFGDREIWFYDTDLVYSYLGKKVFVCYDPEDLSRVIVRDEQERRIGYAIRKEMGGYNQEDDQVVIKETNKHNKERQERVIARKENLHEGIEVPSRHEMLMRKSQHNIDNDTHEYNAKIIEAFTIEEKSIPAAVGDGTVLDFDKMTENARKRRGLT